MSGFQCSQSMDSFNHYSVADAGDTGDQVVDYSKKFADDSEENCRPSKMKNTQLSLISVNAGKMKQSPEANSNDEVTFFCTEDTPLMESSASSCWDLREVGVVEQDLEVLIPEEQTRTGHHFSPPCSFPVCTPDTIAKTSIESNLVANEIHSFDESEKTEPNKEDECIFQETEASFTKSSSPLMFSRSSSVCSLNSFEQHSIVDDRSSVSAFSNLPSGMISPSEIPDSPFEVASPFVPKSKNNEFLFPSNDKPEDPVLVQETIPSEEFPDEAFGNFCASDGVKVYDEEGDSRSVSASDLSALSIQANSTHVSISVIQGQSTLLSLSQKSSVTVNCSVTDGDANFTEECDNVEIPDENNAMECINATTSHLSDVNKNEKTQNIIETTYEDKGTSTSEDFNFHDSNYEHSSFTDITTSAQLNMMKIKQIIVLAEAYKIKTYIEQCKEKKRQSSDCSKDNIDVEADNLMAECISSGRMPNKEISVFIDSKQSFNDSFQTSGSSFEKSFDVPDCSFSDNDVSDNDDDEEEMMKECVLLGMPQNSNSIQIETGNNSALEISSHSNVTSNELPISNSPNHQIKLLDEILSKEKNMRLESEEENLNLVIPKSTSNQRNFAKEEEFSTFDLISQSKDQNDLAKSDDDSDNDEGDLLVQEIVQLGMPKNQSRNPESRKETKLPVTYLPNKNLGCRDDCPDGVSDGEDDEDDDMLNEIIKAGKPVSKPKTNKSISPESRPYLKSQNQRKLTAAEDRQLYLSNKYYYGNIIPKVSENSLIGIDDSTHVWKTEDTPILSPTASISDLSILSFTEDKVCQESFLNNSRNSDCSSESEDDELLKHCISQGKPGATGVVA